MKTTALISCLTALVVLSPTSAYAEKLGEHPAIIAARVYAAQGYDYAAKFYPHPAKLYLLPRAPDDTPTEAAADGRAAPVAPATEADKTVTALRHANKSTR
jgi:hypothetical protein